MRYFPAGLILSLLLASHSYGEPCRLSYQLIGQRLELMEHVARYKASHGLAVENLPREQQVIAAATAKGEQLGLQRQPLQGFFQAQINAAKAMQHRYLAVWLTTPDTAAMRSLEHDIRPALLRLGDAIVSAVADCVKHGGYSEAQRNLFSAVVAQPQLHQNEINRLFDALLLQRAN